MFSYQWSTVLAQIPQNNIIGSSLFYVMLPKPYRTVGAQSLDILHDKLVTLGECKVFFCSHDMLFSLKY